MHPLLVEHTDFTTRPCTAFTTVLGHRAEPLARSGQLSLTASLRFYWALNVISMIFKQVWCLTRAFTSCSCCHAPPQRRRSTLVSGEISMYVCLSAKFRVVGVFCWLWAVQVHADRPAEKAHCEQFFGGRDHREAVGETSNNLLFRRVSCNLVVSLSQFAMTTFLCSLIFAAIHRARSCHVLWYVVDGPFTQWNPAGRFILKIWNRARRLCQCLFETASSSRRFL